MVLPATEVQRMELKVAIAQLAVAMGDPDLNAVQLRTAAAQAEAEGAQLLIAPELWATGYDLALAVAGAAPLGEGPFGLMAGLALRHRLYIVGSALEENPQGRPFNTAALYDPNGKLVGAYRKVHLFAPLGEVEHMTPGGALPVFGLPWGRTALAICYDLRFPEMWRRYMEMGVEIVLIPAEWPARRVAHWRTLLRARAIENQFFVVGCNRAGAGPDGEYGGHSAAFDPRGRVMADGGRAPTFVCATLDLDEVARCRAAFPWLQDRRPEVYG
jgi:predicted amidohydrolase